MLSAENTNEVQDLDAQAFAKCDYYGMCGGCDFQHIPYQEELAIKNTKIQSGLVKDLGLPEGVMESIQSSPQEYGYRNRLDLSLLKTKEGEVHIGFNEKDRFRILPVDSCSIAQKELSDFIPALKKEAHHTLPQKYRRASLVVKVDGAGQVKWGGIGRKSLHTNPQDYLWVQIDDKKIYYSMDSFFQSNTSILSSVYQTLMNWIDWDKEKTIFFDLYGGVGLFSILMHDYVKHAYLIESNPSSVRCAEWNVKKNHCNHLTVVEGPVERMIKRITVDHKQCIALIDPPRKGLSEESLDFIANLQDLKALLYLSCNPDSLKRDLIEFKNKGWNINKIKPFDFFPKTKHVETLVWLEHSSK